MEGQESLRYNLNYLHFGFKDEKSHMGLEQHENK